MSNSLEDARKIIIVTPIIYFKQGSQHMWKRSGFRMFKVNNSDECKEIWRSVSKRRGVPVTWLEKIEEYWTKWSTWSPATLAARMH